MSATLDNCSVHGVCFDNGMSGNCNVECEQLQDGDCDVGIDMVTGFLDSLTTEEVKLMLQLYYSDVEIWTILGKEEVTDVVLLRKVMMAEYNYKV